MEISAETHKIGDIVQFCESETTCIVVGPCERGWRMFDIKSGGTVTFNYSKTYNNFTSRKGTIMDIIKLVEL